MFDLHTGCSIELPTVVNAELDFDAARNYSHHNGDETLTATCYEHYEFAFNQTQQTLTCGPLGWDINDVLPCYRSEPIPYWFLLNIQTVTSRLGHH